MKLICIITTIFMLLTNPIGSADGEIVVLEKHIPTPVTLIVNQEGKQETEVKVEEVKEEVTRPDIDIPLTIELQDYIWEVCQEYEVSYELVLAVIAIESEFKKDVVSYNKTSLGLMQLNKNTYPTLAKELNIKQFDPFNPKHNVKAGVHYLTKIRSNLFEKGLNDEEVLPAMLITYHRGQAGARKYISRNGVRSKYVDKVMKQKYLYEKK